MERHFKDNLTYLPFFSIVALLRRVLNGRFSLVSTVVSASDGSSGMPVMLVDGTSLSFDVCMSSVD